MKYPKGDPGHWGWEHTLALACGIAVIVMWTLVLVKLP